jgi:hypothetical protein
MNDHAYRVALMQEKSMLTTCLYLSSVFVVSARPPAWAGL